MEKHSVGRLGEQTSANNLPAGAQDTRTLGWLCMLPPLRERSPRAEWRHRNSTCPNQSQAAPRHVHPWGLETRRRLHWSCFYRMGIGEAERGKTRVIEMNGEWWKEENSICKEWRGYPLGGQRREMETMVLIWRTGHFLSHIYMAHMHTYTPSLT